MKNKGFTLAEVLITLGVIGITAAMTLPTVINKINRKQDSVKIKKFYSIMSQAVILSTIDNGSPAEWTINAPIRNTKGQIIDYQNEEALAFFKTYFAPYIKTIKMEYYYNTDEESSYAVFADGSVVYFTNGNCIDMTYDLNGRKSPNEYGKDQFDFLCCNKNYNETFVGKNKYFGPYQQDYCITKGRDYIKSRCAADGLLCSTLLFMDEWEFKNDYPY